MPTQFLGYEEIQGRRSLSTPLSAELLIWLLLGKCGYFFFQGPSLSKNGERSLNYAAKQRMLEEVAEYKWVAPPQSTIQPGGEREPKLESAGRARTGLPIPNLLSQEGTHLGVGIGLNQQKGQGSGKG